MLEEKTKLKCKFCGHESETEVVEYRYPDLTFSECISFKDCVDRLARKIVEENLERKITIWGT